VVVADEVAGGLVLDEGLESEIEVMRPDRAGRRGEGEHVVDSSDDLEGALVAVSLYARDPFGIDDTGTDDARDFLLERPRQRPFGAGMIVVVGGRPATHQRLSRHREAALELVVIVAVEQVVLAIVLVVDDGLDVGEARGEALAFRLSGGPGAIGI